VDPLVIALVAGSAVLHVSWNVLIKTAGDPLHAATIGQLAAAAVVVPLGVVAWVAGGSREIPIEGLALGLASGVVETVYFILLSAAYRRGDLSVVYPVARGTAPLVAVVIGVTILGERLGIAGTAGVIALLAGFLWYQRPWRVLAAVSHRRAGDSAIAFAVATGVAIATYSAIDRVGSRLIEPVTYAAILWLVCSTCLVGWIALTGEGGLRAIDRASVRPAAIGGWLSLAAYVAILFALSVSPLTAVAPLRESSIVLASAWGAIRLGEAPDRGEAARRIAASGLIVLGAVLLAFG
jgi:uncharacterized membrane protein